MPFLQACINLPAGQALLESVYMTDQDFQCMCIQAETALGLLWSAVTLSECQHIHVKCSGMCVKAKSVHGTKMHLVPEVEFLFGSSCPVQTLLHTVSSMVCKFVDAEQVE